jgi:hypothetical protein
MSFKRTTIAGLAAAMLTVGAPVAMGQSTNPVQNGYSTPSGVVQSQIQTKTPNQPAAAVETSTPQAAVQQKASSSQLPFTGLDVGLVLVAAAVLLAAGFGIRRITRPHGSV